MGLTSELFLEKWLCSLYTY